MNYYDVLETSAARLVHRLPKRMVDRAYAAYGWAGGFSNGAFVRDVLVKTGVAGERDAARLHRAVNAAQGRYYADVGFLMHAPEFAIRKRLEGRIEVRNPEVWERYKDNPPLVFSAHFACFYIAAFAPGLFDRISVIRRYHSPGRDLLMERLARISGKDLEAIGLTDPRIGMKILSRLKSGRPVAAMIDYFYEDTSLIVTPFMGQDAATPAGLSLICAKLGVPLLPVFVIRKGDGYEVVLEEPLERESGETDELAQALSLTMRMNAVLERMVRQHPDQWTFWPSLPRRWAFSETVEEAPEA